MQTAAIILLVINAGCTFTIDPEDGAQCDGPDQCPDGYRCRLGRCRKDSKPTCGDFVVDPGEVCDDGNRTCCDGCSAACDSDETCGNGIEDRIADEFCDDGEDNGKYGFCTEDCTRFRECGDAIVDEPDEACDDGVNGGYGQCRADCQGMGPYCGDGIVQNDYEVCEPGTGDACTPCATTCQSFWPTSICGDGLVCDDDEVCDDGYLDTCGTCNASCTAAGTGPGTCGDGVLCREAGEQCDDGYTDLCGTCNADCTGPGELPLCGDGVVCPQTEECDEGDADTADCDYNFGTGAHSCTHAFCGDGYRNLAAGEDCDRGNVDTDTCDYAGGTGEHACTPAECGDLYINEAAGETCEDGNDDNHDACPDGDGGTCQSARCGDGHLWTTQGGNEVCDEGSADTATCDYAGGGLSNSCTLPECGDGYWNMAIEECEDGDGDNSDSCPDGDGGRCEWADCGDGFVWDTDGGDEVCDDGYEDACGTCNTDCSAAGNDATCGDGVQCPETEECDDGVDNGTISTIQTYCTNDCQGTQLCGNSVQEGTEACDDGAGEAPGGCYDDCSGVWLCGNGIPDGNEACDDGNNEDGDYCSADCQTVTGECGDTIEQDIEACDDGNTDDGDYCSADCLTATGFCSDAVVQTIEACDDGNTADGDACSANCLTVTQFMVNTYTTDNQTFPKVGVGDDGSFVVVWQSMDQDTSGNGVYGQRYDHVGLRVGDEFRINVNVTGPQIKPDVAVDSVGQFTVAWERPQPGYTNREVVYRQYDANGTELTGEVLVAGFEALTGFQNPSIGMVADGRFVVAFSAIQPTSRSVSAQKYNADGSTDGGRLTPGIQPDSGQPKAAMADNGDFVVVWSHDCDTDRFCVSGRLYLGTVPIDFSGETTTEWNTYAPDISMDDSGNFVMAWSYEHAEGRQVAIRRFNADATAQRPEFFVPAGSGDAIAPVVGLYEDGRFVVYWYNASSVQGLRYGADDNPIGDVFIVGSGQGPKDMATTPEGGFVVTWQNGDDVFAKLYPRF
ncbi:DUF4215 domain-containing protein [Myxococcota bacterium]